MYVAILLASLVSTFQANDGSALETLLQRINSDSAEIRDQAIQELIDLGPAVLPALEAYASRSVDLNARSSIKEVIRVIGAREKVRWLRPRSVRLTTTIEKLPLLDAVKQVEGPFGLEIEMDCPEKQGARVSLNLKGATVWEALDALSSSAGCSCEIDEGRQSRHLRLVMPDNNPLWKKSDHGDARVLVTRDGSGKSAKGGVEIRYRVQVLLPPGTWVDEYEIAKIWVTTRGGDRVESRTTISHAGTSCRRERGVPSLVGGAYVWVEIPHDAHEVGSLRISGQLNLSLPEEMQEVHKFNVTDGSAKIGDVTISNAVNGTSHRCTVSGKTEKNKGIAWVLTAFDKDGAWMHDFGPIRIRADGAFEIPDERINAPSPPQSLLVWTTSRASHRTVPFVVEVKAE
jgi:hypothetical protein